MARASAAVERRMTVGEFLAWSEEQGDEARFELVDGLPLRLMAPTTIRHARVQRSAAEALRQAIAAAGLQCDVFEFGPSVAVAHDSDECRIPDVVVTCATAIDDTSYLVPEPLIVVEVASPSTRLADVNDKVEFYSRIASIRHYLVIEQDRRRMVAFERAPGGGLEPRIVRAGSIALDPPGIELALEDLYRDTPLDETREREER
jgi:Uma2 family endonuclease